MGVPDEGVVGVGDALEVDRGDARGHVRGDVVIVVRQELPRHGVVLGMVVRYKRRKEEEKETLTPTVTLIRIRTNNHRRREGKG